MHLGYKEEIVDKCLGTRNDWEQWQTFGKETIGSIVIPTPLYMRCFANVPPPPYFPKQHLKRGLVDR